MRRISRFFYHLTVLTLCVLIGLNIIRNPSGFRSWMMRGADQIRSATSGVISGVMGAFTGAGPGDSVVSAAPDTDSGQPTPVPHGNTTAPSAVPSEADRAVSGGNWGETGVAGLRVFEYGRSLLSAGAEQSCYDQIADGILNLKTRITIRTGLEPAAVEKIVDYYLSDHAEVFYADSAGVSYTYSTIGSRVVYKSYTLAPRYTYDKADILTMRTQMGQAAAPFLAAAAGKTTDYAKELALHDTVVRQLGYDSRAAADPSGYPESFTAYGAFVSKTAVCEGYAKAMKLLLDSSGVESLYVTGTASNGAESGPHAWNAVHIGSQWYYLDATFDDPVTVNAAGQYVSAARPDYTYFNFRSRADHVLGRFDAASPFSAGCDNYAVMPPVG